MDSALSSPHSQSQLCQHSLSLAIQKDRRFRSLFDLSTPVLLWEGLFTQELWNNLSQHKVPYGWQGLSHEGNLSPVASLLPSGSASPFFPLLVPLYTYLAAFTVSLESLVGSSLHDSCLSLSSSIQAARTKLRRFPCSVTLTP